MTAGLQNTITNVALPTLQEEFEASATELQWFVNSYILVYAGFLLVMGAVGDKYGRAKWLNIGLVIFAIGSVAAAFVADGGSFIVTQVIMGFGAAVLTPATLAIIIDVFPKEERARAIGIWAALAGLGIGVGPLVGGALLEVFWYGSVFLINLPIVIGAIVAGRFLVPDSRNDDAPPIDVVGALLSFGAISAVVYALVAGPDQGWLKPWVLTALIGGAVLVILFVRHEQTAASPLLSMEFFRDRGFTAGVIAISMTMFAAFAAIFLITQVLQIVQERSALEAGLIMTPLAFALAAGSAVAPRLVEQLGARVVVVSGLIIMAVGMGFQGLWRVDSAVGSVVLTTLVLAFGAGIILAPATELLMRAVPDTQSGVGSGLSTVTRQVGGAIGIAMLASVQDAAYNRRVEDQLVGAPEDIIQAATESVAGAHQIAVEIGGTEGPALLAIANEAFVDAMAIAVFIGAGFLLITAGIVFRLMRNVS
jgi:EmrB/QacA subfamily drug resistance transporter